MHLHDLFPKPSESILQLRSVKIYISMQWEVLWKDVFFSPDLARCEYSKILSVKRGQSGLGLNASVRTAVL